MLSIVQKAQCDALVKALPEMMKYIERANPDAIMYLNKLPVRNMPAVAGMLLLLTSPDVKLKNPVMEFKQREKCGDFEPLREDENPENLQAHREPMDDAEYAAAKQAVLEESVFWGGQAEAPLIDILTAVMNLTPGDGTDE